MNYSKQLKLQFVFFMIMTMLLSAENYIEVIELKGLVRYRHPDKNKIIELKVGDKILSNSKVKVGKDGLLKCRTPKKDTLTFSKEGYFKVLKLYYSKNQTDLNISLFKGKLNCDVVKLKTNSSFSIKTPSAITNVRGTNFDVSVDDTDNTTVTVNEGSVAVQDTNTNTPPQLINTGKTANVDSSGGIAVQDSSTTDNSATNNTDNSTDTSENTENNTTSNTGTTTTNNDSANEMQSVLEQQQDEKEVQKLINLKLRINDKD
jgi:hypothetical protein